MPTGQYIQAFLVLVLVLGLIVGLSWLMKRLGFGTSAQGLLGRRRRLSTVEALMIDGRHRAILLRRDDVEHLILIGPNTSQVIEHGIPAAAPSEAPTPLPSAMSAFSSLLSKEKKS